jgi:predicted transcriptional regulator
MGNVDLRTIILADLLRRKEAGILQSEIESKFGFSRAHVSETLSLLISEGKVMERREGRLLKRVWLAEYFPSPIDGVIRISMLASSEYVPFISSAITVCRSRNMKMRVRILKSPADVMDSLLSGSSDIALAPFYSQIIYSIVTRKIKLLSSIASGGSSIFSRGGGESGVLGTSDTSTMIILSRYFRESLGNDVDIYEDPHDAINAFESGRFSYLTIWEPFCSILRHRGRYREILKYSQVLEENPCCVSSCRADSSDRARMLYREIVDDYAKLILQGMTHTRMREATDLLASEIGVGPEVILESLENYRFAANMDESTVLRYMDILKIPVSIRSIQDMIP